MATGTGNLPYPGKVYVPFDILTAQELNEDVANIESIATGTGIGDNAVTTVKITDSNITAPKLATNAITLGYAQITSNFVTTSTTATQITGLSASVTIPAGGRRVRISVFASDWYSTGSVLNAQIWDGTVGVGTQLSRSVVNSSANATITYPFVLTAVVSPSAGAKTYNVGLLTSTGTVTLEAGSAYPAYILVEAI